MSAVATPARQASGGMSTKTLNRIVISEPPVACVATKVRNTARWEKVGRRPGRSSRRRGAAAG